MGTKGLKNAAMTIALTVIAFYVYDKFVKGKI